MFKLVIWDLDGTLVDSSESLAFCMNNVLIQHGFKTHDIEAYKRFIGNGLRKLCERALGDNNTPDAFDGYYRELLDNYAKYFDYNLYVYDGIYDCLEYLKGTGCHIAVNTNKRQDAANVIVDQFFGSYGIEHVYGASSERPKKPDPHSVLAIMDRYGLTKEDVLYIGDSDIDMMTGKNASVHRVGVAWGFRTLDELKAHEPEFIANDPSELLAVLKEVIV